MWDGILIWSNMHGLPPQSEPPLCCDYWRQRRGFMLGRGCCWRWPGGWCWQENEDCCWFVTSKVEEMITPSSFQSPRMSTCILDICCISFRVVARLLHHPESKTQYDQKYLQNVHYKKNEIRQQEFNNTHAMLVVKYGIQQCFRIVRY